MTTLIRAEARNIVEKIARLKGYVSPENRATLEATMPEVLESIENLRKEVAAVTKALTVNLYSKQTRFVFELIQNAEDNHYEIANSSQQEPFLNFSVYEDRIYIDSNEDGFKEADVKAICSSGQSTKQGAQAYIGEKGIGFKSVFKIASKVHIQSGPFSFHFEHSEGDNGLGIVTPVYQNHNILPENVRTRVTLTLSKPSELESLIKEFEELPDSSLMFLSKLKDITISIWKGSVRQSETIYSYRHDIELSRGELTKRSKKLSGSVDLAEVFYYHITKRKISNLPEDGLRPGIDEAEVVLAFPLDKESVPLDIPQHIFAFLPIRGVGFNFQIQSDWVTQASREDIFHSARNEAILHGVAECFADAVRQFCKQDTPLKFQWVRYLPSDAISDPFFAKLLPKIIAMLSLEPILLSRTREFWKRPDQLRWVLNSCLDEFSEPIFEDLPEEIYLSPGYRWVDKPYMDKLNVGIIHYDAFLERMEADLKKPTSKTKSPTTSDLWHHKCSDLLKSPFQKNWPGQKRRIEHMQFIPLQNGVWTSREEGLFYYPDDNNVPVPTDLGLRLINRNSLGVTSRREVFALLGLKHCTFDHISRLIINRYYQYTEVDLASSAAHLKYLFWNLPENRRKLDGMIHFKNQDKVPVYRSLPTIGVTGMIVDDIYFNSDEQYGTKIILSAPLSKLFRISSFEAHYLHDEYQKLVDSKARRYGLSWEQWLERDAGVLRVPRLVDKHHPKRVSTLFDYILRQRRQLVVGTLSAHWNSYKELMNDDIVAILSKASVPCQGSYHEMPIYQTYLPLPELQGIAESLGLRHKMPFIQLPPELSTKPVENWDFLKKLNVGYEANLDFYLDALMQLAKEDCRSNETNRLNLFNVYCSIEEHTKGAESHSKHVREIFAIVKRIYIPAKNTSEATWAISSECLWDAPDFIDIRHSLATFADYSNSKSLKRLFKTILGIKNADWTISLEQLRENKIRQGPHSNIIDIYRHINAQILSRDEWATVREAFELESLIYEPRSQSWYSTSNCLWTPFTRIAGKVAIAGYYPGLEDMFVGKINVEEPDVGMLVEELKRLAISDGDDSIPKIKALIEDIENLGPDEESLGHLKSYNVLPVRGVDGIVRLKNTTDIFAIADRVEYEKAFYGQLAVLAYTIEEAHALKSFISALGLTERYMSQRVKETSTAKSFIKESSLTDDIKAKAYAISRCAAHFGAVSLQGDVVHRRLRDTEVFESERIVKTITFSLQGTEVSIDGASSKLHIEDDDTQYRIYVPHKGADRQLCYLKMLPDTLVSLLGITQLKQEAITVVGHVLNASADVLDGLLQVHGIIELPWSNPFPYIAPTEIPSAEGAMSPATLNGDLPSEFQSEHRNQGTTTPRAIPSLSAGPSMGSSTEYSFGDLSTSSLLRTPRTSISSSFTYGWSEGLQDKALRRTEYSKLLGRIIAAAQKTNFPSYNSELPERTPDEEEIMPTGQLNDIFGRRSDNQLSHDKKIGAAGELYIFEMLLRRNLPNFSVDNWASTIRKEVCIHEKYKDMEPWIGPETADLTYTDQPDDYEFTNLLFELGYPIENKFQQGHPIKYFLEVKTTTKDCGTRLFLSKSQYKRMHDMALSPSPTNTEVYIILRVFNLLRENIGLRLYVDPASMEESGELMIEAESYTVKPGETRPVDTEEDL